jgi:hypothetical protein
MSRIGHVSSDGTPSKQQGPRRFFVPGLYGLAAIGAFVRGDYLLGTGAGVVFSLIASGVIFLVHRAFRATGSFYLFRRAIVLLFAGGVFSVLAAPAWFNPDFGVLAELHQTERTARSQLSRVFSGDPRFAALGFRCDCRKCVVVTVHGRIGTQSDLLDLRNRIFAACPTVSSGWLFWKVTVEQPVSKYDGWDRELFGPPAGDSGTDRSLLGRDGSSAQQQTLRKP